MKPAAWLAAMLVIAGLPAATLAQRWRAIDDIPRYDRYLREALPGAETFRFVDRGTPHYRGYRPGPGGEEVLVGLGFFNRRLRAGRPRLQGRDLDARGHGPERRPPRRQHGVPQRAVRLLLDRPPGVHRAVPGQERARPDDRRRRHRRGVAGPPSPTTPRCAPSATAPAAWPASSSPSAGPTPRDRSGRPPLRASREQDKPLLQLTLRSEFRGRRLGGTAIELENTRNTGATQMAAAGLSRDHLPLRRRAQVARSRGSGPRPATRPHRGTRAGQIAPDGAATPRVHRRRRHPASGWRLGRSVSATRSSPRSRCVPGCTSSAKACTASATSSCGICSSSASRTERKYAECGRDSANGRPTSRAPIICSNCSGARRRR